MSLGHRYIFFLIIFILLTKFLDTYLSYKQWQWHCSNTTITTTSTSPHVRRHLVDPKTMTATTWDDRWQTGEGGSRCVCISSPRYVFIFIHLINSLLMTTIYRYVLQYQPRTTTTGWMAITTIMMPAAMSPQGATAHQRRGGSRCSCIQSHGIFYYRDPTIKLYPHYFFLSLSLFVCKLMFF